jgi:hypothetical protein
VFQADLLEVLDDFSVKARDFIDTRILPYTEHGIGEEVAQRVTQPEMINSLRPRQNSPSFSLLVGARR